MRTRRLSRDVDVDNGDDVVQQNVDDVSCATVGVDRHRRHPDEAENVIRGSETDDSQQKSDRLCDRVVVAVSGAGIDEANGDDDDDDDDLTGKSCLTSSDDRQTVVHRFESNAESCYEVESSARSWASLIDEEDEAAAGRNPDQGSAVQQEQPIDHGHESDPGEHKEGSLKAEEKAEAVEEFPDKAATLLIKSFTRGPPSWRAMGDAAGKNCGLAGAGLRDNPKWRRAAVRAVQIQDTPKPSAHNATTYEVTGNHVASKSRTGNGGIGFDVIPPPPALPGGIPQPPPPPTILPPGPWGGPACVFPLESSSGGKNRHGYDTDSTEHSSSHSSVLVDMGKVVGVLRSSHPTASRGHQKDNNVDNNDANDDEDEEEVPDLDTVNENSAESMVLASRSGCASCAAAAAGKSPKPGSGELDDSLCGDPLMYATFVAPVHQYSTETEPSRQTSFNYPSRQPSFKQNSSEAEPQQEYGYQPQQASSSSFLGGQLPVPRCSSSGSADYERSDEVKDIYEEVPTIDRWPLPPLPQEDNGEVCSVEVSQEELEQQLHLERMSFMSGSSANEEDDEEEMFDDKDHSFAAALPPPPPPPPPIKSTLHLSQPPPYRCRSNRDLNVRDLSPSSNVLYEGYRPPVSNSAASSSSTLHRHWLSAEDSDGCDVTSGGTVRRKAKRERNKTTTGVMTTTNKECEIADVSASVSPACSAPNVNRSNSFKRAKPARSKCSTAETSCATPPPPIPPHQMYYKSHTVLEGPARPGGLSSIQTGRLASPDQFSESSASFHENEFIGHDQPQAKRTLATAEVHHHHHQQQQQHHHHHHHGLQQQQQQQPRRMLQQQPQQQLRHRTPPPLQFSNRDSVRESWMSSGSEYQGSSGSAQLEDRKHHFVQQQPQHQPWHGPSAVTSMTRGSKSQRDLLLTSQHQQHQQQQQQQPLSKMFPSSTTLPRPSRSVGNLTTVTPTVVPAPLRAAGPYSNSSRSLSRESGSSSSRAASRTEPVKGSVSRARVLPSRQDAQEGKNRLNLLLNLAEASAERAK